MKKKSFLIIGGAGFIGKNLIKKIDKNKNKIYVLDIMKENKKTFKNNKNIHLYNGDIGDNKTFNKLKKNFDKVFFLAAETSTFLSEQNPLKCIQTNITS